MAFVFEEDQIDSGGSISHAQVESRFREVSWEYLQRIGRSMRVGRSVFCSSVLGEWAALTLAYFILGGLSDYKIISQANF